MTAHEAAGSPDVANWISTGAAAIGIAIAAAFSYFRKPAAPKLQEEVAIVSATFSDRRTIEALTAALNANSTCLHRNNELLEADAHRREVEAEVREALRKHGIVD